MGAGIRIRNKDLIVQIDSSYLNSRLVVSGYCDRRDNGFPTPLYSLNQYDVGAGQPVSGEVPLILIRPTQSDKFVGKVSIDAPMQGSPSFPGTPNGSIWIGGECPFDYAICSSLGTPVQDASSVGFRVTDPITGRRVFDSRWRHVRLAQVVRKPSGVGFPFVASIVNKGSIPWLWGSPLIGSSGGNSGDLYLTLCAKVSADLSTLTIDVRNEDFSDPIPSLKQGFAAQSLSVAIVTID